MVFTGKKWLGSKSGDDDEAQQQRNIVEGMATTVHTSSSDNNNPHSESKHDQTHETSEINNNSNLHHQDSNHHHSMSEFFQYVRNGNNEMVESMIMSGRVDVNGHDLSGVSLYHSIIEFQINFKLLCYHHVALCNLTECE